MLDQLYAASGLGVVLGVLLILFYTGSTIKSRKHSPKLGKAVGLFLSGQGIWTGARVAYIAFTSTSLGPFNLVDKGYLVLGGLVVVWVSVATIGETFYEIFSADKE